MSCGQLHFHGNSSSNFVSFSFFETCNYLQSKLIIYCPSSSCWNFIEEIYTKNTSLWSTFLKTVMKVFYCRHEEQTCWSNYIPHFHWCCIIAVWYSVFENNLHSQYCCMIRWLLLHISYDALIDKTVYLQPNLCSNYSKVW